MMSAEMDSPGGEIPTRADGYCVEIRQKDL